jgi:hypothetical protein
MVTAAAKLGVLGFSAEAASNDVMARLKHLLDPQGRPNLLWTSGSTDLRRRRQRRNVTLDLATALGASARATSAGLTAR